MIDVAIIGAGMAGLVCAQQLTQAGYSVVVVEKSRGVGGRVATRRLHDTYADHGTCYLKSTGELLERLIELLSDRQILKVWTDTVHKLAPNDAYPIPQVPTPRYVASLGMNAIAKFLTPGLDIRLNQRLTAITPDDKAWRLTLDSDSVELTASAVVFAIPAPQALTLLEPVITIDPMFLENLRSVEYSPSLTVMAGYPVASSPFPEWQAVTFEDDADLAWVGFDSSKRTNSTQPVFVVQSSAALAIKHLDTDDLALVAKQMLQKASVLLPWLSEPEWIQVQRWRYAFPSRPWQGAFLSAETSIPLVCCGDWCGGDLVAGAMVSGAIAAAEINNQLLRLPLPGVNFLDSLAQ
jgi:renalase